MQYVEIVKLFTINGYKSSKVTIRLLFALLGLLRLRLFTELFRNFRIFKIIRLM